MLCSIRKIAVEATVSAARRVFVSEAVFISIDGGHHAFKRRCRESTCCSCWIVRQKIARNSGHVGLKTYDLSRFKNQAPRGLMERNRRIDGVNGRLNLLLMIIQREVDWNRDLQLGNQV